MSEFTPLREAVDALASRSPSPDFGALKRRATRRGRRRVVMVAAAGALAFIAVGGGLTAGSLGGSDRLSPIGEPTTPPSPTTVQESVEPAPESLTVLTAELHAIFAQVPGWAITNNPTFTDYDYAFNGPCSGDWGKGAKSGGDGGVAKAGIGGLGFPSEAKAADAAARFVENLESCTATAWRTQPIAETGAVLASSADGVAWIQQKGADVQVLQVPTTDGPPPVGVQVQVAEWMVAYSAWQDQSRSTEP